jgi:hypothetical protein
MNFGGDLQAKFGDDEMYHPLYITEWQDATLLKGPAGPSTEMSVIQDPDGEHLQYVLGRTCSPIGHLCSLLNPSLSICYTRVAFAFCLLLRTVRTLPSSFYCKHAFCRFQAAASSCRAPIPL